MRATPSLSLMVKKLCHLVIQSHFALTATKRWALLAYCSEDEPEAQSGEVIHPSSHSNDEQ